MRPYRPRWQSYFIIEHPTRGLMKDIEFDEMVDGLPTYKVRWTTAEYRTDERVEKFFHEHAVREALRKMPSKVREMVKVLQAPVGDETEWKEVKLG